MITVKNLNKSFNDKLILKDINIEFKDKGIYFIVGDSGCGKTTFLNCLSGLISYDGEIDYDSYNISSMSSSKIDEFRLKNLGFIFQDFRLFLNDTAIQNIIFPLECITNAKEVYLRQKAKDLLKVVGIKNKKDDIVSNLSGGEKQRVAIARALVNDPKVLLCDEPTGALDSKTSLEIMDLLKELSKKHLIIVVSHDIELANKYANYIISMKDGRIESCLLNKPIDSSMPIAIYKNQFSYKRSSLPFSFLFRHAKNSIKARKIRTFLTNMITSLAMAGIGLAFVMSDAIKTNIMQVYSSLIEDNQLLVTSKFKRENNVDLIGASYEESLILLNRYKEDLSGLGVCYYAPFESFFPDRNEFSFASHGHRYSVKSYSFRNINEFVWLEDCKDTIYPLSVNTLEDDEIVLSLSLFEIKDLCQGLRIEKRVEALSDYIDRNDVYLGLDLANLSWQYEDQQLFKLKGFTVSNVPTIYHSNHLWNMIVYEDMMHFPSNHNLSKPDDSPWTLKQISYFKIQNESSNFYHKIFENDDLSYYIFQLADNQFYPWLYATSKPNEINRLMVFLNTIDSCQSQDWKYFKQIKNKIKNPIFSTYGGYSIYGSAMLVGFANPTFFAANRDYLERFLNIYDDIQLDNNENATLPDGILKGHFSSSTFDGVVIKGYEDKHILGRPPDKINEVVISSQLSERIFHTKNAIGEKIYLSSLKDTIDDNDRKISEFIDDEIDVVGVIEENKNVIYQNEYWSLAYFMSRLGVSGFNLIVTSFTFELDNKRDQENVINELSDKFPQYFVINPLNDISKGLDKICFYLEIALGALSLVTIIISLFLITINDYLHIKEKQRDFGIIRCIGINKNKASSLLYFHSCVLSLLAFITACMETFVASILGNIFLSNYMGVPFIFKFNLFPYIAMFCLALFCGLLPAYFISFKLKKMDPIQSMKN